MPLNYDSGRGACEPSCLRVSAERLYPDINPGAIIMPADGVAKSFNSHTSRATAFEITIRDLFNGPINNGCEDEAPAIGVCWKSAGSGSGMGAFGGSSSTNSSSIVNFEFYCPYDLYVTASSYQTGGEYILLHDGCDEWRRGQGAFLTNSTGSPMPGSALGHRENVPATTGPNLIVRYDDDQGGGTRFIWRNVSQVKFQPVGNSLQSNWVAYVQLGPNGHELQRCLPFVEGQGCTPTTTPRWRSGCSHTTDQPAWFTDFAAGAPWEYSNDSGATWNPAPASAPHTAGDAAGLHRWRQEITIPSGYRGFWFVQILNSDPNIDLQNCHGTMTIDGQPMSEVDIGGYRQGIPMVNAGLAWSGGYREVPEGGETVMFEWREGARTANGTTTPVIEGRLGGARRIHEDVQVLECLNSAGTVASTQYFTLANTPYTPAANQTVTLDRCSGCP